MVIRSLSVLCALLAAFPLAGAARQAAQVEVGVRPDRVRVGETFVVTVRTTAPAWPDQVDVDPGDLVSVVDYEDRTSAGVGGRPTATLVFERIFRVQADAQGTARLRAFATFGNDTVRHDVQPVAIYPPGLTWPTDPRSTARERRRDNADPVLPEGTPPSAVGRDADRERSPQGLYPPGRGYPNAPGAGYRPDPFGYPNASQPADPWTAAPGGTPGLPYGNGYPNPYASPYGPSGWGVAPYGSGWAPTAAGDPWWPEVVPRLERYETAVDDPNGLLRLEAGLAPERVYVGQQVTFIATATFPPEATARLGGTPEFFPPTASNAWSVDLPYAPPTATSARGRAQEAHTFMRAFFPLSPGRFTVDPARLLYSVGGGTPGRPLLDSLSTERLVADVLPLPERDAPPGWGGAVGRYRVEAWLQPESVAWGEASLLTVAVSGAGNVRALTAPDLGDVWGVELRPTGERALPEIRDGVVGGVKTFSWLVVPVEPGPLRIGPVIFSFFDPWTGAFSQVASEELVLMAGELGAAGAPVGDPRRGGVSAPSPPGAARPGGGSPGAGRGDEPIEGAQARSGPGSGVLVPLSGSDGPPPPGALAAAAATPEAFQGGQGGLGTARTLLGAADTGFPAAGPSGRPFVPPAVVGAEEEIRTLEAVVKENPDDAEAWFRLTQLQARAHPGEGWSEWASLSGLRNAPRHAGLRAAAGATGPGLRSVPGLARVPLRRRESLILGGLLTLLALLASTWRIPRMRGAATSSPLPRAGRVVATGILLVGAALAFEPARALRSDSGAAVVVGGATTLRSSPTLQSAEIARIEGGTPLRTDGRFGGWVRARAGDGMHGWIERSRVAWLPPVPSI